MIGIVGLMKQAQPTDFSLFPVSGLEVIHWRQWVAGKHTIVRKLAATIGLARPFSNSPHSGNLPAHTPTNGTVNPQQEWPFANCLR